MNEKITKINSTVIARENLLVSVINIKNLYHPGLSECTNRLESSLLLQLYVVSQSANPAKIHKLNV